MSLSSTCEPLECRSCPFMKCEEKDTCYNCECFLDTTLNLDNFCDYGKYPLGCLLLDGQIITIKVEKGHLIIERNR